MYADEEVSSSFYVKSMYLIMNIILCECMSMYVEVEFLYYAWAHI